MKILYVATVVKTHIMEFHIPYLKMMKEEGWETAVAARNDYEDTEDCAIPYCDIYYDVPFERNPVKLGNIKAYRQLKKIIDEGQYDIIHCHTPVGALLTRLAAIKARKNGTKVIYTAHGFHFYKGAPLINWLLYYPVEKLCARWTDVLITINKEDYELAKRKLKARRVEYVPGVGIDVEKFAHPSPECAQALRKELCISSEQTVLLSVGEVNANKNHALVIKALPDFPNAVYVVCGRGPLVEANIKLAERLGVAERVHFVGYRTDVADFYGMADIFVFPSFREGLPVSLMEAMASGLPIICSKIRGNTDLIRNKENGIFAVNDPSALAQAIRAYQKDEELRGRCAKLALMDIQMFGSQSVMTSMHDIYGAVK